MQLLEIIRNLIEGNRNISLLYDAVCQNHFYRGFVLKKIEKRINFRKRNKEFRLLIEICSICNASCIFCPYPTLKRSKELMSDDIFNTIISRIKAEQITPLVFDLFMIGEPLIDSKLFDRIKTLKQNFPKAQVGLTSNFALGDLEKITELLTSGLDSINISLNATDAESYKKIMGLDYDKTVNNINNLLIMRKVNKSPLKVSVSMVLCEENKKDGFKFLRTWMGKVDSVHLQRAVEWSGKFAGMLSQYNQNKFLFPCNEIFERIPILSNGDFALCCQDSEGMIKLNIADTPILEAFEASVFSKIQKLHLENKIKDLEMCKNCFAVNSNGANWLVNKV